MLGLTLYYQDLGKGIIVDYDDETIKVVFASDSSTTYSFYRHQLDYLEKTGNLIWGEKADVKFKDTCTVHIKKEELQNDR